MSTHPMTHSPTRRALLALLCAAPLPVFAQPKSYTEVTWDELVPPDWDPANSFKDLEELSYLPDSDPKVQRLYDRMRKVWDEAPTVSTLNQKKIKLPGFVVPLEEDAKGMREFLLVPYFGACIHTPPPPANQIIHVFSDKPIPNLMSMDTVWVTGRIETERKNSDMGVSGYRLDADEVTPFMYEEPGE